MDYNIKWAHQNLVPAFNITPDEAIKWIPKRSSSDSVLQIDQAIIISDIASVLLDNGLKSISEITEVSDSDSNFWYNPFKTVKRWMWYILYAIISVICVIIILRCCVCSDVCFQLLACVSQVAHREESESLGIELRNTPV